MYILVGLVIGGTAAVMKRANAGVSGPSHRQRRAEIAVLLVAWVLVYVFEGALYAAGASPAIVYGLYPATAGLCAVFLGTGVFTVWEQRRSVVRP